MKEITNELENQVEEERSKAEKLVVVDEESYLLAGETIKGLTALKKKVTNYWEEPKANAYKSWKTICKKEKDMLNPIEATLSTVKQNYGEYELVLENEQEKANADAMAEYGVESLAKVDLPKVEGVSSSTDYEINSIDIDKLPKVLNGIQLVKIDNGAIKKLIKMSKGNIEIPGVSYSKKKIVKTTGR